MNKREDLEELAEKMYVVLAESNATFLQAKVAIDYLLSKLEIEMRKNKIISKRA